MTKKEEFEEKFCYKTDDGKPQKILSSLISYYELWSWVENELLQAKIDENKKWLDKTFRFQTRIKEYEFTRRISELKKEK